MDSRRANFVGMTFVGELQETNGYLKDLKKKYDELLEYHTVGRSNIRDNRDGTIDICYGHHKRDGECEWVKYQKIEDELNMNIKIITLCGSTKFKEDYLRIQQELALKGYIVLSCPFFHHADELEFSQETNDMMDDLHMQKISISSEIFVINKGGYIGDSTKREIVYALQTGKVVKYMEPIGE